MQIQQRRRAPSRQAQTGLRDIRAAILGTVDQNSRETLACLRVTCPTKVLYP
jgi:hypothetical protein